MKEKTRDEIAEELRAEGYNISIENSVIIIRTDNPQITREVFHSMLLEKGYDCSYGMHLFGAAAEECKKNRKNERIDYKPTTTQIDSGISSIAPDKHKKTSKKQSSKEEITGQISLF